MTNNPAATAEISVAVLSWINDQLRTSAQEKTVLRASTRITRKPHWYQQAVTLLSIVMAGLCVMVLQTWS